MDDDDMGHQDLDQFWHFIMFTILELAISVCNGRLKWFCIWKCNWKTTYFVTCIGFYCMIMWVGFEHIDMIMGVGCT